MSAEVTEKTICIDLAKIYQCQDWHRLTEFQKMQVADLQALGYLEKKEIPNGFVGLYTGKSV